MASQISAAVLKEGTNADINARGRKSTTLMHGIATQSVARSHTGVLSAAPDFTFSDGRVFNFQDHVSPK